VFPEHYKNYSFLQRIRENFFKLPEIKGYYNSEQGFNGDFYPSYAQIVVPKVDYKWFIIHYLFIFNSFHYILFKKLYFDVFQQKGSGNYANFANWLRRFQNTPQKK